MARNPVIENFLQALDVFILGVIVLIGAVMVGDYLTNTRDRDED